MRRQIAAAAAACTFVLALPAVAVAHDTELDTAASRIVVPDGVTAPAIIPFETWAGPWCPRTPEPTTFGVERLVVHHTSDPVASSRESVAGTLREICAIHLARGFDTIGYHYAVDPWGRVWQARGALPGADGRAPRSQIEGAHVAGTNPGAVGVVFIGDHDAAPPTADAVEAATQLLAWLTDATGLDPAAEVTVQSTGLGTALVTGPIRTLVVDGHSHTNATLCPGRHLEPLLDPIRDEVRARIATRAVGVEPVAPTVTADGTHAEVAAARSVFATSLGLRAADEVFAAPPVSETSIATTRPILTAPDVPAQERTRARLLGMLALMAIVAMTWREPQRR